jgi:hypothetical protein
MTFAWNCPVVNPKMKSLQQHHEGIDYRTFILGELGYVLYVNCTFIAFIHYNLQVLLWHFNFIPHVSVQGE